MPPAAAHSAPPPPDRRARLRAALEFQLECGVDTPIASAPPDRSAPPAAPAARKSAPAPAPAPASSSPPRAAPPPGAKDPGAKDPGAGDLGAAEALATARRLAEGAESLEALRAAIAAFEGLAIKQTATHLVFARGDPDSPVMVVGEAPGADEDRQGLPFVGKAGRLLDAMLAAAGLPPERVYITNVLNWRPPGNRKPTAAETALARPFIRRHIALKQPAAILALGNVSAQTLLETTRGITRLRGAWADLPDPDPADGPRPVLPSFHPAFLLRQPAQKQLAWRDLLAFKTQLRALGALPG